MAAQTDSFMSRLVNAAQNKKGVSGAIVASDLGKYQWGVKLPHLMLEYLFGLNVIPYPAVIELAGPPGSCKSAFLQFLMRVFAEQGHNAVLIETEGKMSSTLFESILLEHSKNVALYMGLSTQEAWQKCVTGTLKMYRKYYIETLKAHAKKPANELARPLLLGLDSLGAAPSEEAIDQIDKEGFASRSFPVEALKNAKYFAQVPSKLRDLPVTFIYTNHEMQKIDEKPTFGFGGAAERKTKGGATPDFFCGVRLFFQQRSKPVEVGGKFRQDIAIECYKNSFNQKGNRIILTMEWEKKINKDTNKEEQVTTFLWGRALCNFLKPSVAGYLYDRNAVKSFLTVTRTSDTKFSCKELDATDMDPEQLGSLIESIPEKVTQLRPYLGIKEWNIYNGEPFSTSVKDTSDDDEEDVVEDDGE